MSTRGNPRSAPYEGLTDDELDIAIDHARTNANSRPTGPEYRQWWDTRAKALEAERERRAPQPDPSEAPIEEVMNEVLPGWRELARRMADDGRSDEEIVAEIRRRMYEQVDSLLDTYNALGGPRQS